MGKRTWRRKPKGVGGGVSGAPGLSKDVQETAMFLLSERQTAVLRSCPGKNAQITRGVMVHPSILSKKYHSGCPQTFINTGCQAFALGVLFAGIKALIKTPFPAPPK